MSDISTVGTRYNGADLEFYDKASGNTVMAYRNANQSNIAFGTANGLTAHAGGGQTNGTPIVAVYSRFTTVATGNDSATLPVSTPGLEYTVINAAASNSMNVFPASGDAINALSANTAFAVAANKVCTFFCCNAGQWHTQLTA